MGYLATCLCHLQYLSAALQFSECRSFTSLVTFIPGCFMMFGAIINGIAFLISLSVASLLEHKNGTDFCTLISYLATLLHSLSSSLSGNSGPASPGAVTFLRGLVSTGAGN